MTDSAPLTRDRLLAAYHSYGSPNRLVGGEFERHLLGPDGMPIPYFGERGVRWLLERMAERGWSPHYEGEHPIALERDGAWITLEPGGQFELSGAPFSSVAEVMQQSTDFIEEVGQAIGDEPIYQVALGFTPFAHVHDIPWVPKGRYAIMKNHLATTGKLAHHMMKGTAAVQASFDFADEADCARKVQLATRLGPLTTALFANSPLLEGKPSGFASFRGHVWTQTDPARTGFPEAGNAFTFEGWVDYLLDVPMMFTKIAGTWAPANGRPFRAWMEHGIDGVFPTWDDWELHLTSVFPEVRIKRTIEVRGADCVPIPLATSFVALFKGLFYCQEAMDMATDLAAHFVADGTHGDRFEVAVREGLRGKVGDRRLSAWAEELLDIAALGVGNCTPDDIAYLAPLARQVETGHSPSHRVLQAFEADPSPEAIVRTFGFHC